MNEALIAAAATLAVCMINNYCQQKRLETQLQQQREESEKKHDETVNLIVYRLDQLEKKQDKYNNIISRTYELEKSKAVLEEEIKVANHRIDDLEQFHKP